MTEPNDGSDADLRDTDAVLRAIEALRDDVRRVGRAVVSGRPEARAEARPEGQGPSEDDRWALALLPLADSLDRCVRAARSIGGELKQPRRRLWVTLPGDARVEDLAEGMQLAVASLEATLAARGYRLDRPLHCEFDATRHCAVATEPGSTNGVVARTESAGLWHGARLLREASVVVTTIPAGAKE